MELRTTSTINVNVLSLSGRFDTSSAGPARQWLDQATGAQPAHVVVNLAEVQFADSTALSVLVQALKRSRELGGDLRLCCLQQPVRMIFELTRLDRVFEIYVSEEDAIQSFQV